MLFVSNHVSWLDILALGGAARSTFVSKAEVKTTPLVGWLADQNNTIYVQRDARRDIQDQASSLRAALARGRPVTLFPEGTTGPGDGLLPFRASLFQAIIPTPPNLQVQPVFLDYGEQSSDIAWLDPESWLAELSIADRQARGLCGALSLDTCIANYRKAINEARAPQ